MKKILLSAIIIAAAIGCSKKNTETTIDQSGQIRLSSGIQASRAAYSGDVAVAGLQILRANAAGVAPTSFDDAALIVADRTADDADITFATAQYYDGANNAYFVGYFPAAVVASNVATWTVDAKTDIMTSQVVDAGTDALPLNPALAFKHALAQIEVICKAEAGNHEAVKTRWGKIEYIKLKDATPTVTFTYADQSVDDSQLFGVANHHRNARGGGGGGNYLRPQAIL